MVPEAQFDKKEKFIKLETFDSIRFDCLYETFVHNELKRSYQVKYWRTTAKTEVDFVV